ncbi:uncharacterized protein [Hetaerina americana]|uniref:uncharacterized protein n=1 Tax=Hetaerina americana TaxID=62018 RepID=UPI003A7F5B56
MVECLHHQLKAAIRCHGGNQWTDVLPMVLMGMRATFKEGIPAKPAEVIYGQTLWLPGEFFSPPISAITATAYYVSTLQQGLCQLQPQPVSRHGTRNIFMFKDLEIVSHVFLRNDRLHPSLNPPYDGPFPVIQCGPKTFKLKIQGREVSVVIDCVKPAYVVSDDVSCAQFDETPWLGPHCPTAPIPRAINPTIPQQPPILPQPRRSQRRVHFPKHSADSVA